ncbi:hypothetical protein JCM21900_005397 [Sporobolomyces salmonicolor]
MASTGQPCVNGISSPSTLPSTADAAASAATEAATAAGLSGDLWSSILDSAKGSRGIATKQCIILGAPKSGKSTLIERISSPTGEPSGAEAGAGAGRDEPLLDLGLSYSVLDVKDDGDEETLARLSLFQLPSPLPPYPSLLPLALSRQTLLDSLIVIVLDWERPWGFIKELKKWVAMLERVLEDQAGKDSWEAVEGKERLEAHLRAYHEPAAGASSAAPATTSTSTSAAALDADAPLPPGTLTDNLGIGIVVVCTKADQMNSLEREREFTEEQFDYIQQTLRTICMRYGASLFFTSHSLPSSFVKLRQYLLHRLFSSPSPSSLPSAPTASASAAPLTPTSSTAPSQPRPSALAATQAVTRAFPFLHRPNVVDRDQLLVPTGWDSWGKIRVLKERFGCEAAGEGWEADLGRERERQRPRAGGAEGEGAAKQDGLQREYEMVVVDFDAEDQPHNTHPPVLATSEQSFLSQHYATLQAEAEKDPRLAFRQPTSSSSHTHSSSISGPGGRAGLAPSVVGPMAGQTLDLPSVVGALERASAGGSSGSTSGREREKDGGRERERERAATGRTGLGTSMSRQNSSGSGSGAPPRASPLLPPSVSPSLGGAASSTAPSAVGAPAIAPPSSSQGTAGAAAGGNQVLADFFQSLLTARSGGGASPTGGAPGGAGGAAAGGGGAGLGASVRRGSGTDAQGGRS